MDARNWGAAGIPQHELDPDVQRRELAVYEAQTPQDNSRDEVVRSDTSSRPSIFPWHVKREGSPGVVPAVWDASLAHDKELA